MKSLPKSRQTNLRLDRDRHSTTKRKSPRPKPLDALPDFPAHEGGLLLVGMCPGTAAVSSGHYFQGAFGKRVWKKLALAGLVGDPPATWYDEMWSLDGNGLTDVVKRAAGSLSDLRREEIAEGVDALRKKVRKWKPCLVLFAFKMAAEAAHGVTGLRPGPCVDFEGVATFLLSGPFAKPKEVEREAALLARR
jgi:mismatch-specific thymine-DNA glycosylase